MMVHPFLRAGVFFAVTGIKPKCQKGLYVHVSPTVFLPSKAAIPNRGVEPSLCSQQSPPDGAESHLLASAETQEQIKRKQ